MGELMQRARTLVGRELKGNDLTQLLLDRYAEADQLVQAIQERVEVARRMANSAAGPWQHVLVVIPEDPSSADLREGVLEALAGMPVTILEVGEALLVDWESVGLSLAEVAARLCGNDATVADLASKVQTRRDVAW